MVRRTSATYINVDVYGENGQNSYLDRMGSDFSVLQALSFSLLSVLFNAHLLIKYYDMI